MRYRLVIAIFLGWAMVLVVQGSAADNRFDLLIEEFDARPLNPEEKRVLQSALALEGDYVGSLDGRWGRLSQEALEAFSWRAFSRKPLNLDVAVLIARYMDSLDTYGWRVRIEPSVGLSFAMPETGLGPEERAEHFVAWEHPQIGLSIVAIRHVTADLERVHGAIIDNTEFVERPALLRNDRRWLTLGQSQDGLVHYIRSDYLSGAWSTILLKTRTQQQNLLALIVASITLGPPYSLSVPLGGRIEELFDLAATYMSEVDEQSEPTPIEPNASKRPDGQSPGSGSGFFVNDAGDVLTNAHVVEGCDAIRVNGSLVDVAASSATYDLAILRPRSAFTPPAVASFSASPARLNSDVTVVGFPLHGVLGGINVTRGSVSALSGFGGDLATMQISAPISAGNSGGPVINKYGQVVGVVVAKLHELAVADRLGSFPQNINFSVRAEIAKSFLASQGVEFSVASSDAVQDPTAIAKAAQGYSALVTCQ